MDGHIDYSGYTLEQLREAESGINPVLYPINFANVVSELKRRGAALRSRQVPVDQRALPRAVIRDRARRVLIGFLWFLLIWNGVGAIAAGIASSLALRGSQLESFQEGFTAGRSYGREFAKRYGLYFFFGGLVIAIAGTSLQILPGTKRRVPMESRDHATS